MLLFKISFLNNNSVLLIFLVFSQYGLVCKYGIIFQTQNKALPMRTYPLIFIKLMKKKKNSELADEKKFLKIHKIHRETPAPETLFK